MSLGSIKISDNERIFTGLSSDTKPTASANAGNKFLETNTCNEYIYSGDSWYLTVTGGSTSQRIINGTGRSAKNRAAINVGTTAQEITWQNGDEVTEVTIIASLESGVATTVTSYALVCFDVASAGVAALIGTGTAIPASLTANQNGYMVPLNTPITFQFTNALSYDGTTYMGNMWVRSIDNTNQLDIWAGAN